MSNPYSIEQSILANVPTFTTFEIAPREWRDGLLVRSPNWLGDAVMALPAMWTLKRLVPSACGLFVVCPEGLRDLFEGLSWVDVVAPLSRAHRIWTRRETRRVRFLQAGAAVLLNNSLRDAAMFRLALVPRLFGMAARCRSPLMTLSYRLPRRRPDGKPGAIHHAAKYLGIARSLGSPAWDGTPPPLEAHAHPETAHPEVPRLYSIPRLMVMAAGAAYGEAKRWPAESFRDVASHWIESGGNVVTVGSGKERPIGDEIVDHLPPERAFNAAGLTRLSDLMVILANGEICVANDSGVMHLAAMTGTPGVAVFGSTDPLATGPVSNQWIVLTKNVDCAPCFKRTCPLHSYRCLREISSDEVVQAVESLVNKAGCARSGAVKSRRPLRPRE